MLGAFVRITVSALAAAASLVDRFADAFTWLEYRSLT
jgi:hypothetical protein